MHFIPIISLLLFTPVYSQPVDSSMNMRDSVGLDEIEVTAARYPQQLRNLAVPVQLVSQSKLQLNPTGDLSSALASVPGVQLQSGTYQTLKLTLRGIGSRSQYNTNRTKVYLDDIPLTNGDGISVFDDVDLTFLSKAEVTKGSYAAWHGSGMGGSLRFVTIKETEKKSSGEGGFSPGSFGLMQFAGIASFNSESVALTGGVSRVSGNGYRQNSSFTRNSGLLSGEIKHINFPGKINYLLIISDVKAFTPSSLDESTFINNPAAAAANWLNVKGHKDYQRLLAGLKIETPINNKWTNNLIFTSNYYDQYELRPFNILDDRSVSLTLQETIRYRAENFSFISGIEAVMGNYTWQTFANNTREILNDANENTNQFNLFANAAWNLNEKLKLTLAGNLNFTSYALHDKFLPDLSESESINRGKAIFSPMTGLLYQLSKDVSLYFSAGHGFSNPTVEESLNSLGKMNINLKPEQGWTVDAGIKTWLPKSGISLQGAVYSIWLSDLLVTVRPEEDIFYGENAGSSLLRGAEITYRHQPIKWFNYQVSGSISNNQFLQFNENGISYNGKKLPGIPDFQLYSDIEIYILKNLMMTATFRYQGTQFADDANIVRVSDWKTINSGLKYEAMLIRNLKMRVNFQVNNLLNEHYASMILINAPTFSGRSPRYFYPALPRNIVVNIRFIWN